MEVNHLRYFFEVAKAGSFTEAARHLRISQSALSKSVALLEENEGVLLLERSKKGVSLTALGKEVFLKAERIFQILGDIEITCRGTKEVCEGPLRFAASDHITNYLLSKVVKPLREVYPKVVPSVFSGTPHEIIELILANEIEFGLFFSKVATQGIKYEPLLEVEMAVVCHPRHLSDSGGKPGSGQLKKAIEKAGFIGSIKKQYQRHPSQDLMNILGFEPDVIFETNSQETQKRICLEGEGVAYLALFMVEEDIKFGRLAEIPLRKKISLPIFLASRRGRELPLSSRQFLGLFRDFNNKFVNR